MRSHPTNTILIIFFCILITFLGSAFFYHKISSSVAFAQAHSCISSIAAALKVELEDASIRPGLYFEGFESSQWETLSSEQYSSLLVFLESKYKIDTSGNRLDPWGYEYQIAFKRTVQDLHIRIFSLDPRKPSEARRNLEATFQVNVTDHTR
jgi:hypothetical protein